MSESPVSRCHSVILLLLRDAVVHIVLHPKYGAGKKHGVSQVVEHRRCNFTRWGTEIVNVRERDPGSQHYDGSNCLHTTLFHRHSDYRGLLPSSLPEPPLVPESVPSSFSSSFTSLSSVVEAVTGSFSSVPVSIISRILLLWRNFKLSPSTAFTPASFGLSVAFVLAHRLEITKEVSKTEYCGNDRSDITTKICDIIATHTGRRTFVVHCAEEGWTEEMIRSYTGHEDFEAMRPYFAIGDKKRRMLMESHF